MKLEIDIPYYVFEQVKRENTIKNVLNRIDFAIRNGVERPHGTWGVYGATCSKCGKESDYRTPFCAWCGADMRGE